ncbi:aromatic ring-hydroxylating dioxygenase subunit alpha [Salinicola sp. JS01]|uniref:aromatic ring-hydroxylating dioxygenase subunit alpha n=1 Tax=Salinicola sp. JS01 TaxID=3050071 RepID=UPI00255B9C59|nr:aromatic ring-hydroxylating dioxygenase subunit alpha [Salinicola sp. JS01]WIX33620.1 aromatic ring-hydroxylating dioxygenase subunit alpha [Salinicola sp. JS01]
MSNRGYPLNAWYAAAWGHEIQHRLTPRTLCETDLVLYRRSDGEIAALQDACWHRLLPLSLGRLDGDSVVCGYHGLAFDPHGRCTHMPSQETINPAACVRSFPVAERHALVWVWMGHPARADTATIPDFHWNADPALAGRGGTFYSLQCEYRLVIDNLLDLTHETFVHAGSIGHDSITRAPFDVTHDERSVTVQRWMLDGDAPPFWARQLGRDVPVDRWHNIHFEAPSTIVGDVGVAEAGTGAPQGDRSHGVTGYFLAALTPETATSCHYFWNFVRDHHIDDPNWTEYLHYAHVNDGQGVYDQDKAVLQAQQIAVSKYDRPPFYNLNIDAGAMWARRIIDRLIAAEETPPAGEQASTPSVFARQA